MTGKKIQISDLKKGQVGSQMHTELSTLLAVLFSSCQDDSTHLYTQLPIHTASSSHKTKHFPFLFLNKG